ncbi:hypothetical protein [Escherichia phage pEC-N1203-2Af.1]|nr:hypothetical protein [Escherichia phage pEC-N1203-2Af.1]
MSLERQDDRSSNSLVSEASQTQAGGYHSPE